MAYEIKIKGLKEPIRAENHGGVNLIKSKWEKYMNKEIEDVLVTISKWTGTLGSITYFREIESSNASSQTHEIAWGKSTENYFTEREKFLKLTSEEKSKNLNFFRMLYWGFTLKKSEEVMIGNTPLENYVINIQREFFDKNPKRMLCDPQKFRKIMKSNNCHNSILGIIEGAVMQDLQLAV